MSPELKKFIRELSRDQAKKLLRKILEWQIDEHGGDSEIQFDPGDEDNDPRIYWAGSGEDIL